jgi:hypothetical protein
VRMISLKVAVLSTLLTLAVSGTSWALFIHQRSLGTISILEVPSERLRRPRDVLSQMGFLLMYGRMAGTRNLLATPHVRRKGYGYDRFRTVGADAGANLEALRNVTRATRGIGCRRRAAL